MLQHIGLHLLAPQVQDSLLDWWLHARSTVPNVLCRGFDCATLLTAWMIWKERNKRTFDKLASTPSSLLRKIKDEADDWVALGFKDLPTLVVVLGAQEF